MSTPPEIEAAIPFLSARELAELKRILHERGKKRPRPAGLRAPKSKPVLALSRRRAKGLRAQVA